VNFRCLTSCFRPPQNGTLYVLTVSRRGNNCARYQSAAPCSFDSLELFAHTFQEYFEGDARRHLWFIDVPTGAQLVYDNHDLIYSYGNDDSVISCEVQGPFGRQSPNPLASRALLQRGV